MQSNKIKLLSITYTEDEIGNQIPVETVSEVWGEVAGIRQSEFYNAAMTGMKPEITFVIWGNEYAGQSKIEYEGRKYKLIRTYINPSKSEMVELICEKVAADG